jgi:hypothetical protein
MTIPRRLADLCALPRAFWLPPTARGNGLAASRWAEIAVVDLDVAAGLLAAFRAAGVPACSAADRSGRPAAHVWVDPDHHAVAENVLLHEMALLNRCRQQR